MTGLPPAATAIPPPLDSDDDDVAWALQTAQVQWKLGSFQDALVWLRRAVDSAIDAGHPERAAQINRLETSLSEQLTGAAANPFENPFGPPGPLLSATEDDDDDSDEHTPVRSDLDEQPLDAREVSLLPYEIEDVTDVDGADAAAAVDELMGVPISVQPEVTREEEPTERRFPSPPSLAPRPGRPQSRAPVPAPVRPSAAAPVRPPRSLQPPSRSFRPPVRSVQPAPSRSAVPPSRTNRPATARSFTPPPEPQPEQSVEPELLEAEVPISEPSAAVEQLGADEVEVLAEEPSAGMEAGDGSPAPPIAGDAAVESSPEPPATSGEADEAAPESPRARQDSAHTEPQEAEIAGILLADVPGLQDLPEEAQLELVKQARIERLAQEDEVSAFAVALVLEGWVDIMPTVADAACARARRGEVVFTTGTLAERVGLRVVSGHENTRVAVWDERALAAATADCPWVADELRMVADRYQALAGACMGPMGDRLDDSLRSMITDKCEIRRLLAGEIIIEQGRPLPGLFIIGAGRLEITAADGSSAFELAAGDFVFAAEMLGGGSAPATVRAGNAGALVLFAERRVAHELMVVVPPLLEILAG
jgi:hypothetical protein